MKLLTLTHYFASHRGGIEIAAGQLNNVLAATRTMEIVWAASANDPPPASFSGRCISLPCSNAVERILNIPWPIPTPGALRTLRRLVDDADLVLIHEALFAANIAAFLFARRRGKRVVLVQHVGHIPYKKPLLSWAMRIANRVIAGPMLSKADRVVFISGLTAEYFSQRCAFRRPPKIIFNGIAESIVEAATRRPQRKARIVSRPATVAYVGRFVEKKGLSVLERIARALPEVQFVLAGWGNIRPEDWKAENVTVHRNLRNAELIDIYRCADLLVLPSVGEGFPLVVQEALCCGTPVLCGEEILRADPWLHGRIEVAPVDLADAAGTAALWIERIVSLLSGRAPMPRVEADAARARYAWQRSAAEYLALFDEIGVARSHAP